MGQAAGGPADAVARRLRPGRHPPPAAQPASDDIEFGDRRAAVLHDYNTCLETRQPYVSEHSFWTDREFTYRIERVILPLSDNGETVSHLVSGLEFDTTE